MTDERALAPLTEASRMLAEAKSIPDLKQVRDFATTARAWAKSRGMGIGAENQAAEYVLRAERRIGLELVRMAETGERTTGGTQRLAGRVAGLGGERRAILAEIDDAVTLADIGVSPRQSSDWQRLAGLDEARFEQMVAAARVSRERLSKVNFYRAAKNPLKDESPEVPIDKGFDMFRAGAYHLLGWRIGDAGTGGPTRNGLLDLPDGDLIIVANVIMEMAKAYNAARAARS